MKNFNKQDTWNPANSNIIKLQDFSFLENLRIAGKIAAQALLLCRKLAEQQTNILQIEKTVAQFILDSHGELTFKNYKGFPGDFCISINNILVHGIPYDYVPQDGDILKFDLGVTYHGAIADSAISLTFGTPKSKEYSDLLDDTKNALFKSISNIKVGDRLGVIGNTIYNTLKHKYKVIENYGGHGISMENNIGIPHAPPFVANKAKSNEGIRIVSGMVLAIEPMALLPQFSTKTITLKDGWSVQTEGCGSHFEETIYVHSDYVEIITDKGNI